ncbi:ROK family protein [Alkalicoccus luteus]|uniref:ROK family protein n=1 Tax=Alkalicoccus luteus TaxID=1237094 RepID=A0A969TVT4_9BACI|nr:ROK family protein [Alkalicoccus luteus]NJP38346.1 ROK family protein [Alkalicoccus luteus]
MQAIGIDIGGTSIRAASVDESGHVTTFEQIRTPFDPEEAVRWIAQTIDGWESGSTIGVAAPGPLQAEKGLFLDPPNLPGWHGFPFKEKLEAAADLSVIMENDANAAAAAEWVHGAGKGTASLAYVTISTGVGAGLIVDGRIIGGFRGNGGEVGNMIIADDGPHQQGMNRGSWESLASGTALGRRAHAAGIRGGAPELFSLASSGDQAAEGLIAEWIDFTARGLANLFHTVDPDCIVIGGGVSGSAPYFMKQLREAVAAKVYKSAAETIDLRTAALGRSTGVIGAAVLRRLIRV